jgi:hypothetical protein
MNPHGDLSNGIGLVGSANSKRIWIDWHWTTKTENDLLNGQYLGAISILSPANMLCISSSEPAKKLSFQCQEPTTTTRITNRKRSDENEDSMIE